MAVEHRVEPCDATRETRDGLLRHVEVLSREIGPRRTGGPGERRAADYIEESLAGMRLAAERMSFRAVGDQNWMALVPAALFLLSVAIHPWSQWSAWLGVVLALAAVVFFWSTITRADSPLRAILPRVTSTNVMAHVPASEESQRTAVVVSHIDSNRCRIAWRAGKAMSIKMGSFATLAVYSLNLMLLVIGAVLGIRVPYFVALMGGLYVLGEAAVLLLELWRPYSEGAHDNAAGVAVNLGLAKHFARQPLKTLCLCFLFTGAEEVDHRGIKEALKRDPSLRRAWFIVLEGPGSGDLCYLEKEGVLVPYFPDGELVALAERIATTRAHKGIHGAEMVVVDEVQTLRRLGCQALCIAGRDPATQSLPHWHTSGDTFKTIDGDTLVNAQLFVQDLLLELEKNISSSHEKIPETDLSL